MTTVRELKDRIREIIATVLETGGFELVDVEVGGLGSRTIVKVLADRPGGILLEECAAISRQLSPLLDNVDLIPHRYTLEVSSPGLDRPLVTERDFRRRIGEVIKVQHLKADGKETERQGKLLDCEEEKILIETEAGIHTVSLSAIKKAKVVIL
jgi:ribosome maturation factor RimP